MSDYVPLTPAGTTTALVPVAPTVTVPVVPVRKTNVAIVFGIVVLILIVLVLLWWFVIRRPADDVVVSDTVVVQETTNTFTVVPVAGNTLVISGPGTTPGQATISTGDGSIGGTIDIKNTSDSTISMLGVPGVTLDPGNAPGGLVIQAGMTGQLENIGVNTYMRIY